MQRLGLRTAMAALVGDDEHGWFCRDLLSTEGVDCAQVRTHSRLSTGITVSLSYPNDRMLLTRYGTMAEFRAADIDPTALRNARHLHVGSFFIQAALRPDLHEIFAAAQSRGQTTSLDLCWDPSEMWDVVALRRLLPYVTVVFPNHVELAGVTRTGDLSAGLSAFQALGAGCIALKLGKTGALVSTAGGVQSHGRFSVDVVDTTGAGDAFNAGYLWGLLDGAYNWTASRWQMPAVR